jgi:CBS-domain-containing membrane protein
MDGEQVCGIIAQTDVLQALQEALLREELDSAEASDSL